MMTSSKPCTLRVADIVEHNARREGYPNEQGKGLLIRLVKKGSQRGHNLWEVRFFSGVTFEILEEYLKKVQGVLDTDE